MPFNNSPFSADMYTILKDDTTGRLSSIEVKTVDRFNEFAVNLAKSAGAVKRGFLQEGSQLSTELCQSANADIFVLATLDFDPADEAQTRGDLAAVNEVMLRFAEEKAEQCAPRRVAPDKTTSPDEFDAYVACREYRRIVRTYDRHNPPIRMRWVLPSARRSAKADCSVGFCYRHTLPHTVQLSMAGASVHSYTYQLPNASPIVAMDITRAITVTKTTKIDFGDLGQITKIVVQKGNDDGTKGSEAEGLALVPMNVVNAYFSALGETARIIQSSVTAETELAKAQQARDETLKKRQDAAKPTTPTTQEGGEGEAYAVVASNGLNANKAQRVVAAEAKKAPPPPGTPAAPAVQPAEPAQPGVTPIAPGGPGAPARP